MNKNAKVITKYKVGQVVRINTDFYLTKKRIGERYQRIIRITPWGESNGACLTFANGDECHEKYVLPLTEKEIG